MPLTSSSSSSAVTAWIALGANLGECEAVLRACLKDLDARPGIAVGRVSTFIETEPVGGPADQPKYLNGAAELHTSLSARELLQALLDVERVHGRVRDKLERNAPRTADLDLLLYGNAVIDEPGLQVPHPRLHERAFVLQPLKEIAAEVLHPVLGKKIGDIVLPRP